MFMMLIWGCLGAELTSAIALVMTTMPTSSETDSCSPPIAHPSNTATAGLTYVWVATTVAENLSSNQ